MLFAYLYPWICFSLRLQVGVSCFFFFFFFFCFVCLFFVATLVLTFVGYTFWFRHFFHLFTLSITNIFRQISSAISIFGLIVNNENTWTKHKSRSFSSCFALNEYVNIISMSFTAYKKVFIYRYPSPALKSRNNPPQSFEENCGMLKLT